MTRCYACERASRKPGKHRAHQCEGQIVGHSVVVICNCECQALPSDWEPPPMFLG